MSSVVRTDYDEVVRVEADENGDVVLAIVHGIGPTEAVLRPTQAERLAEHLLAYANGDHNLPSNAIRPRRLVDPAPLPEGADWPEPWDADECRCAPGMHTCGKPNTTETRHEQPA